MIAIDKKYGEYCQGCHYFYEKKCNIRSDHIEFKLLAVEDNGMVSCCSHYEERITDMKNRCGGCTYWDEDTQDSKDKGRCNQPEARNLGYCGFTNRHFGCIFYLKQETFSSRGTSLCHMGGNTVSLPGIEESRLKTLCDYLNALYPRGDG